MESDFITADMIEAVEFPHLVNKYGVFGVPRTIINETESVEGAVPEEKILSEIMKALQKTV
jgi:predicted DsbA family dithiol-disulfide isomerase